MGQLTLTLSNSELQYLKGFNAHISYCSGKVSRVCSECQQNSEEQQMLIHGFSE